MAFRLTSPIVKLSENDVEKQCLDLLRLLGFNPIRLHAGTFKSLDGKRHLKGVEKGTPDYCVPLFYVETKRPGEKPTPEQTQKIEELQLIWKLPSAVVSSPEELQLWLEQHNIKKL